ncbi:hypothetical protein [Actinomycetospora sp.]|uniref:hypothetical protein n=1 Tax=Actinomycetospora sp. TaxID=1872135 RepID=UPI002F41F21A
MSGSVGTFAGPVVPGRSPVRGRAVVALPASATAPLTPAPAAAAAFVRPGFSVASVAAGRVRPASGSVGVSAGFGFGVGDGAE